MTDTEKDRLSALIDGALSHEEAQELEENPEMAETIARMRRNDDLVRAAVPLEEDLPDGLLERLGLAEPEPSNVVSLAEARERLTRQQPQPQAGPRRRWGLGLAAAAAITLAVFGANRTNSPLPPVQSSEDAGTAYRTLSSPAQPGAQPNALVVFIDGTDRARASAIIQRAGGRIIGEPSPSGAWKLAVPPQQRDEVLGRLRSAPGVTMAEPLDGDPR